MMTRRALLGAGVALTGLRWQAITCAIDAGVSDAQREGIRFGVEDAGRAASLLGRSLEVRTHAGAVITTDGMLVDGVRFFVRADRRARDAAMRQAHAAGVARSDALQAVEWHHSLFRFGASELNARFAKEGGARMSSDNWLGWMAVKIIAEASLRARAGEPLVRALERSRYDGHKGTALGFSATDGSFRLQQPLYVVDTARDRVVWPE